MVHSISEVSDCSSEDSGSHDLPIGRPYLVRTGARHGGNRPLGVLDCHPTSGGAEGTDAAESCLKRGGLEWAKERLFVLVNLLLFN